MSWDVCRICLAGKIKMHCITNTQLQNIFEKLTGNQWIKDRRPITICYICRSQLTKSQKFIEMYKLSEEVFTQLFAGGFEFTDETVPILNKRKLQKMLVTPIETLSLHNFSKNGTVLKKEIPQKNEPVLEYRERKLKKLLVTPVETAMIGIFLKDTDEIQSMNNIKKIKLQKLLVTPVKTSTIGTFPDDDDKIQSLRVLNKNKLQKLSVTPVKTTKIGTPSKYVDKIQSMNNQKKHKLQKLLVTPVKTVTIGTCSDDNDIMSMQNQGQNESQKSLVTPIETTTIDTFYNNTEVKEEITPKEEPHQELEASTLGNMDTFNNGPRETDIKHGPFSEDIMLYIPSHEKLEISSSNEDIKPNFDVKSEMTEPQVTYEADIKNCTDTDLKISKHDDKNERDIAPLSQKNHVEKSSPCIKLRFKINDKITHRNTQLDAMQGYTKKREYPFENYTPNGEFKHYACKYCNETFMAKYRLEKHMKCHADGNPYACDACDRTFKEKISLELHKKIHNSQKPFSCSRCPKTFHRLTYLNQHLKCHNEEKLYKCGICEKSFKQLTTLKQHNRTHTGEKPYACDECDKRFSQISNLIQHKRVHTGEKPYSCWFCNKTFAQISNLEQHKRIHGEEKPFSCDLCSKAFNQKSGLLQHVKNYHSEKFENS